MSAKSLLQITSEVNQLEQMLIEGGGEITETIESMLAIRDISLPEKVDSYSFVLQRLESNAQFYKERAAMFQNAAKTIENAQKSLKDRLKIAMHELQVTELAGNEVKYKLTASKPKLVIEDVEMIPLKYKREVISTEIDKEKIEQDLRENIEVIGAKLEPVFALRQSVNTKGK